jgi:hypothetical protein
MDQPGSSGPRALVLVVCERRVERPGRAFAPNRGAAGFLGSERCEASIWMISFSDMPIMAHLGHASHRALRSFSDRSYGEQAH